MKKFIQLCLLFVSFTIYSQESENRNEIKFNGLSISLGTVEIEFERTLNENSSIGLAFFNTFNETGAAFSFDFDSGITGFYRYFFSRKYAEGVFLEGFGMFHSTKYPVLGSGIRNINNFLIGLGVGYKHVFKNGIILQANFGIGNNISDEQDKVSGRTGISIGYRF